MIQSLLQAITPSQDWVKRFTRFSFREAYAEYTRLFQPVYLAAVNQSDSPEVLADKLLEALEAHWKSLHFWDRNARRVEEKMVLVSYLCPMLLAAPDPRCALLAEALRNQWNSRRPQDPCDIASYEDILGGFRFAIMGFDLEGKHFRNK